MALSATNLQDVLYWWLVRNGQSFPDLKIGNDTLAARPGTTDKIDHAYDGVGGWEWWAQVEIATMIKFKYNNSHKVTREEQIYQGNYNRTDLVLRNPVNNQILQIIELKCERQKMGPTGIVREVKDDVERLERQLRPEYAGASCFAVGISCTETALKAIIETEPWNGHRFTWQPSGKTPAGRPITVFWVQVR